MYVHIFILRLNYNENLKNRHEIKLLGVGRRQYYKDIYYCIFVDIMKTNLNIIAYGFSLELVFVIYNSPGQ